MKLEDVLAVEKWQDLAKELHERYGMNGAVSNREGFIIHSNVGWANEVCPLIKGNPQSRVVCASVQQNMIKEAKETKSPVIGECDIGFTKFVLPIFYQGEFLGVAGGCGVLLEGNELDTFYIAKLLGKDEKEVQAMVSEIKPISQNRLQEAIEFTKTWLKNALRI